MAPEHRDGAPLEQNWILRAGSEDFARLVDYRDDYQPGARRFDMGQRTSFQLVPMAVAALEQLLEWEPPRIAATLADLNAALAAGALARLGLEPLAGRTARPAHARASRSRRRLSGRGAGGARPTRAASPPLEATRCASRPICTTRPRRLERLADALAATVAG